jgi:predicted deacetylase
MSQIAVSIHDVEPATFDRCALIRDWLDDHGIVKATLLVIPASDMHPFHDRSPELAEWLAERVGGGDCVAQHGFQHRRPGRHGAAEFRGLDDADAKRAVDAGHRVLHLAGVEPRGFVAPAFAYTAALQRVLAARFDWWASLSRLWRDQGRRSLFAPALTFGSPLLVRAGALLAGPLLRLDLHPSDLDHPARIGAIEAVLRGAGDRQPVTYDEVAAA